MPSTRTREPLEQEADETLEPLTLVAADTGGGYQTLWNAVMQGRLRSERRGARIFVSREEVDEFLRHAEAPRAAGANRSTITIAGRRVQYGFPVSRERFVALARLLLPESDRTRDDFELFAHIVEPDDGGPWTAGWADTLAEHLREHASHRDLAQVARTVGCYIEMLEDE